MSARLFAVTSVVFGLLIIASWSRAAGTADLATGLAATALATVTLAGQLIVSTWWFVHLRGRLRHRAAAIPLNDVEPIPHG